AQPVAGSSEDDSRLIVETTCLIELSLLPSHKREIRKRTGIAALIAGLTPGHEAGLETACRMIKIAEIGEGNSERVVRYRHPPLVPSPSMKGETHLRSKNRLVVVALRR